MEKYKKLDANMIKLIAILAMTIDHITWMIFPGYPKDFLPILLHIIGRITCPIMCYFIAEGYHYTKNVNKYTNRLFAFAFLSHFAYVFASMHFSIWNKSREIQNSNAIDDFLCSNICNGIFLCNR